VERPDDDRYVLPFERDEVVAAAATTAHARRTSRVARSSSMASCVRWPSVPPPTMCACGPEDAAAAGEVTIVAPGSEHADVPVVVADAHGRSEWLNDSHDDDADAWRSAVDS
jgi:hypothetical protein